jgi:hypothetical protein
MPLWRLTAGRAHAFSDFVVVPAESFKLTRRLPRYHFTRSAAGFQHHVRNVRVQRAIERYAGDRGAGECRRGYAMGQLPHRVDELEPPANSRSPDGCGIFYRCLLFGSVD